jgi:hypothetical protein
MQYYSAESVQQKCINNLRQILFLRQPGSGQQERRDGQTHREQVQECAHNSFKPGPVLVNFKKASVSARRVDCLVRTRRIQITATKMRNTSKLIMKPSLITLTYFNNPDIPHSVKQYSAWPAERKVTSCFHSGHVTTKQHDSILLRKRGLFDSNTCSPSGCLKPAYCLISF